MANSWFRMYAEFLSDPKVQMMNEQYQRRLVMMFCNRCNGNVTLQDDEVAFQLRIGKVEWAETKKEFISRGFIDESNNVLNWDKRQFRSDSSAERVRKHRNNAKKNTVTKCNVTVTPPEQNRTDTEQKKDKKVLGTRFALLDPPSEWIQFCMTNRPDLDPGGTFDSFKDYWIAKPGKEGIKLDWQATWRNWIRNQKIKNGAVYGEPPKSQIQRACEATERARLAREQRSADQAG